MPALVTDPPTPETTPHARPGGAAPPRVDAPAATARVVYFIASHVNPDQVERLVRACRTGSPRSRVVIHHDYRVSDLDPRRVERFGNVEVIRDFTPVGWGRFTMAQMVWRSMRRLLDAHDFDWCVYLTGQDYPLQPLATIERWLTETGHDGFLDCKPVEQCPWVIGPQRYLYQYFTLPKFPGHRQVRNLIRRRADAVRAAGGTPRLLVPQDADPRFRVGYRPMRGVFNDRFRCYFGSCWWTLNRRCVDYMVRYAENHPNLVRHYRRIAFAPNESFWLTILRNNSDLDLVVDDNKRFVRWSRQETGHPDVLAAQDFEELIASGKHFGRKFDQRKDGRVLDMLDDHVGANG